MTSAERVQSLQRAHRAVASGSLVRGVEICRSILAKSPSDLETLELLASLLGRMGKAEEAVTVSLQILRLNPTSQTGLSHLASALRAQGRHAEAAKVAQDLVRLAPNSASGYVGLGLAQVGQEDLDHAIPNLAMAASKQPNLHIAHAALGSALYQVGELEPAEEAYRFALQIMPGDLRALTALAKIRLELADPQGAEEVFFRIRQMPTDDPVAALAIVRSLNDLGAPTEAEGRLRQSLDRHPDDLETLRLYALRLQETGRFEESFEILRRAVRVRPQFGLGYFGLVQGRKIRPENSDLVDEIQDALKAAGKPEDQKYLHYALGKAFDDLREFASAIGHFRSANELAEAQSGRASEYSEERYRRLTEGTATLFTKERLAAAAAQSNPSDLPIFIVGMMRSGTTLTEQIVSSHPRVAGAGELDYWLTRWRYTVDFQAPSFKPERVRSVTSGYLGLLHRLAPDAARVTDKMPQNFMHLGVIHAALPNAKVLHCRRNPIDTCLSIYMNPYEVSPDYAHRFSSLASFYRVYESLMEHWKSVMPEDSIADVVYEDVIADKETESRRMVDFCGLEWDDACLRHDENERSIVTSSIWQARQKVYTTSVARWKNYEPWLGELAQLV